MKMLILYFVIPHMGHLSNNVIIICLGQYSPTHTLNKTLDIPLSSDV